MTPASVDAYILPYIWNRVDHMNSCHRAMTPATMPVASAAAMTHRALRVSAPGKALVTGGYLVLDERFAGLVLSTSARFYAQIAAVASVGSAEQRGRGGGRLFPIAIESAQYDQRLLGWIVRRGDALALELDDASDRNAYIEETMLCALNGIAGLETRGIHTTFQDVVEASQGIEITLQADNDFYSQVQRLQESGLELTQENLRTLPKFLPPVATKDNSGKHHVAKTGMGSSAALVTSLVAALVSFFAPSINFEDDEGHLQLVHHLAQLAHCYIQRKIGSGFDIAAACFGSQRYRRFPSSILGKFTTPSSLAPTEIAACITNHATWNIENRTKPFSLPRGLHLMMGDVFSGSATVSMVRKVLAWQKAQPHESGALISSLNDSNKEVEEALSQLNTILSSYSVEEATSTLEQLRGQRHDSWISSAETLGSALLRVRSAYLRVRQHMREMGQQAGVPIEPEEQTELLDATMALPGVLMAGVPGAGGYDAIFVVGVHKHVLRDVEKLWVSWPTTHPDSIICPLLCDVDGDSRRAGVRLELFSE